MRKHVQKPINLDKIYKQKVQKKLENNYKKSKTSKFQQQLQAAEQIHLAQTLRNR